MENSKQESELKIKNLEEQLENQISQVNDLMNDFNDYKLNMSKIVDQINSRLNETKTISYKLSDKKVFNILHYTNKDIHCPSADRLKTCANSIGVTFNIIEERMETGIIKENIDAVLVSTWSGTDKVKLGQDLLSYINTGVNIVIVLFSNSTNYQPPEGIFNFIELKLDDYHGAKTWKKLMSDHPLFDGNPTVSVGSEKRRAVLGKIHSGSVDLVAEWEDGIPMMAVRKDLPGLVTQLGFQCGREGSQDGLRVVINALRMIKC